MASEVGGHLDSKVAPENMILLEQAAFDAFARTLDEPATAVPELVALLRREIPL